jgi:hypothetical protein
VVNLPHPKKDPKNVPASVDLEVTLQLMLLAVASQATVSRMKTSLSLVTHQELKIALSS